MKKLITLLLLIVLTTFSTHAQTIFWTENFESGSTSGTGVTAYTGPNGTWTQTITGTEGSDPNPWYVSCAENGHTSGVCGTGCAPVSSTATLATLHVGAATGLGGGDGGASYDAGGLCGSLGICVGTDRRAESPTINCTGRSGLTVKFYYIMNGQAGVDYATVWYYDGTSWSLLASPAQTAPICPPVGGVSQGLWTAYSVALPTSANNNANVKLGFRWVNNDDAVGSDPSFAVDSLHLVATTTTTTVPTPAFTSASSTACQDSCITFTNTTTGTVTSYTWSSTSGFTATTATATPVTICFTAAAVYTVTLTAISGSSSYPVSHTVTINPAPAGIAGSHTICVGFTTALTDGTTGGTWSSSTPSIATIGTSGTVTGVSAGVTTISYTLGTGCTTLYTFTVTPIPCTTGVPGYSGMISEPAIQPNPATNELNLAAEPSEYKSYTVTNQMGQTLIKNTITSVQTEIDIRSLPAGLYYIVVKGNSGYVVRKFVKS